MATVHVSMFGEHIDSGPVVLLKAEVKQVQEELLTALAMDSNSLGLMGVLMSEKSCC